MDYLSPIEIKILKFIPEFPDEISIHELNKKFRKKNISVILDDLTSQKYIVEKLAEDETPDGDPYLYPTGIYFITDKGSHYLISHASHNILKLKDRLFSIVSSAAVGFIVGLLLGLFGSR